jgi:hypothetical protein
MGRAGVLARTQLRHGWRAIGALALLVAAIAGLATALVAGSMRSASVVDRYFAAGIPYDLQVFETSLTRDVLVDLPGVVRADPSAYVAMVRVGSDGTVLEGINGTAIDWASVDPTIRVLEGEVPDGTDPFDVLANEAFAEQHDLGVGDRVDVQMFGVDQGGQVETGDYRPSGPRYAFRIAGVVRMPIDIAADEVHSVGESASASENGIAVSVDFYAAHRHEFLDFGAAYDVQLAEGARDEFVEAVEARGRGEPVVFGPPRFQDRRTSLESPVELETNALLLLGVGIAIAGIVMIALLLRAERRSHEHDEPTLRTVGYTSHQLGVAALLRTAPAALGGAVAATVPAVVLSSQFPVGIGRQLELDGGLTLDAVVVGLGGLATALVVSGFSYLFGRATPPRGRTDPTRPALAGRLAGLGAPTGVVIGTQLAFAGGRRGGGRQSRAGIFGGAAALSIVVAVGTFLTGIDHLYTVPTARGWAWDAVIGNVNFPLSDTTVDRLAGDPRIEAHTVSRVCAATVGGQGVEVLAVRPEGTAPPVLTSGRLPVSASEIALGARLAGRLAAERGDLVRFSVAGGDCESEDETRDLELTVVGVTVPPVFGESDIGQGAVVTLDAVGAAGGNAQPQFVMARFRGADPATIRTSVDRDLTEEILTDSIPAEVVNLHRVRALPLLGLVIAGAMGTVVLVYTLAVGRRGHLRDLAVLRTLGLSSAQLRRSTAWEGVLIAGAMLAVGLPVGFVVGRALWREFAAGLGVAAGPISGWLLLVIPLCAAVAIVAASHSARRARRASVATLLHVE